VQWEQAPANTGYAEDGATRRPTREIFNQIDRVINLSYLAPKVFDVGDELRRNHVRAALALLLLAVGLRGEASHTDQVNGAWKPSRMKMTGESGGHLGFELLMLDGEILLGTHKSTIQSAHASACIVTTPTEQLNRAASKGKDSQLTVGMKSLAAGRWSSLFSPGDAHSCTREADASCNEQTDQSNDRPPANTALAGQIHERSSNRPRQTGWDSRRRLQAGMPLNPTLSCSSAICSTAYWVPYHFSVSFVAPLNAHDVTLQRLTIED
jgi:hypothetical protein